MKHNLPIKIDLTKDFLCEEVRSECFVSSKIKKIWAVELDLLAEFARVCDKYSLQWFIAYGSLLGTIRHGGFIPWDNDIDVVITQDSFKKLCEIAEVEFKHPYFFQTPITENGKYYKVMAKLCNSETTGASELEWLQGINCGLFLDIFVLYEIPSDKNMVGKIFNKVSYFRHFERFLSPYTKQYKGTSRLKHWIWSFLWKVKYHKCGGDELFRRINRVFESYKFHNCDWWVALESTTKHYIYFPNIFGQKPY